MSTSYRYKSKRTRNSLTQTHPDFVGEKITELWAWVLVDPVTGGESSIGSRDAAGNPHPLIGANRDFIESCRHIAEYAARQYKATAKLVHFPVANTVETLS